jgi:SAM-dependent methyltransferase
MIVPSPAHRARQLMKRWLFSARFPNYCPLCETQLEFQPFGAPARPRALCPQCGSLERHRLTWLFLQRQTDLFDGRSKTLLHIAPEPSIGDRLRHAPGIRYCSMDLSSPTAMTHMDITKIALGDRACDVVYCSHVLEHIPDDRAAMRECRRVLRPGGWAIFLVPIVRPVTDEDPSVVDPTERTRRFGQEDHVRAYGPDFQERLVESGFTIKRFDPRDVLTTSDPDVGVQSNEWPIYVGRSMR